MDKKGAFLFAITVISLVGFILVLNNILSKSPNEEFSGLTGNVILNLNNFNVGDNIKGDIIINEGEESYCIILLTKGNKELYADTFYLDDYKEGNLIKIENLIDYTFTEKGKYELFFSALELNISLERDFVIK